MERTSVSHPLQIASVKAGEGMGSIGLTLCPGKHQAHAASGAWKRDLDLDLDAVEAWGAAAVVTLLEPSEMAALNVTALGEKVRERHMTWYHLPIPDGCAPGEQFLHRWKKIEDQLIHLLLNRFNVLIHCKGGLGRAGTVGASLLVAFGNKPSDAIKAIREARPGAIETESQLNYILTVDSPGYLERCVHPDTMADRAHGALLGLAVGDAIGMTLEFSKRDSQPRVIDMVGGGPFGLRPGEWTDDTAMALAFADSLASRGCMDEHDLMRRFLKWRDNGEYSCTGKCFDIGVTTNAALDRFRFSGNPIAGSADPRTAGNGSLMRMAPAVLRYIGEASLVVETAVRQSMTTHAAPEAVDACAAFAEYLSRAIRCADLFTVFCSRYSTKSPRIAEIENGSWKGKRRHEIASTGYVVHSLEAAIWCVTRTSNFADAVLLAANLGDDADTTAAITGQLAGALYGVSGIPEAWREKLAWSDRILEAARRLTHRLYDVPVFDIC